MRKHYSEFMDRMTNAKEVADVLYQRGFIGEELWNKVHNIPYGGNEKDKYRTNFQTNAILLKVV